VVTSRAVGDVFVKFRYDERDVAAALRMRVVATLRRRSDLALAPFVCVAACVAGYVYAPAGPARFAVMAISALVFVILVASIVVLPRAMFRRRLGLHVPMSVDASDEGITVIAGPVARTIAWSDCARVEKGARVCVIHHGAGEAFLLPRRAFRDASREAAFFDLVARHARRDSRRLDSGKSTPSANQ